MKNTSIKNIIKNMLILVLVLIVTISTTVLFAEPTTIQAATKKKITLKNTGATVTMGCCGREAKVTTIKVKSVTGLKSKKVTYKSSNEHVATVSSKGVVTGISVGNATITVTSKEDKKVKTKFKVKVKGSWVDEKGIDFLSYQDLFIEGYGNLWDGADTIKDMESIAIAKGSDYENLCTARGIKLGDTKKEVEKAYKGIHCTVMYKKKLDQISKEYGIDFGNAICSMTYYYHTSLSEKKCCIDFYFDKNDNIIEIIYNG